MKRAVVVGGGGFVGANFCRYLLSRDCEVHILDYGAPRRWRLKELGKTIKVHSSNLSDYHALRSTIRHIRPHWIFNMAVHGAYSSQNDFHEMVRTNIEGSWNLFKVVEGTSIEALVQAGSSSEYGYKDYAPAEDDRVDPNSLYAITKACSTHLCQYAAGLTGAPLVVLRLYSVYGPWEEPTRLIPSLLVKAMSGKWPSLTNPKTARDFVYIDDVMRAFELAARKAHQYSGQIYNVGSGLQKSLGEVVNDVGQLLQVPEKPMWGMMRDRSWDTNVWIADARKIHKHLGWKPRHDFRAGLEKTLDWFQSNPALTALRNALRSH